ncbi:MAG: aldehyde ferredoxin oxidoreductase family protein [Bacillota bacterium]
MTSYSGKILRYDLTSGSREEWPTRQLVDGGFVGGMGFGVKLVTDEVASTVDALDPGNLLVISTGPLSGTYAPLFAQTNLVTKSPLTGGIINSYCGGTLAGSIKNAGYDALVIAGRARELSYLVVTPDRVELVPCPELAGQSAPEAEEAIKRKEGGGLDVMSIGLAGENRVRFSAVIMATRAFGRGGPGAVFGSKKLKAIAVGGHLGVRVADVAGFRKAARRARETFEKEIENPWSLLGMFSRYGTGSGMALINEKRTLATRNHRRSQFDKSHLIDGMAAFRRYPTRPVACLGCPVHCGQLHRIDEGPCAPWARGPEYETMYSLGSDCEVSDLEAVVRAHQLCESYGMDTLSAGCTVAFAMEAAERGLLPRDAFGAPLEFGSAEGMLSALEHIARRQGAGDLLAEGTRRAADQLGNDAAGFAMNVKGMEFAAWMPQRMRGIALTFATSNRGACHKRAPIGAELMGFLPMEATQGKARVVKEIQDKVNALSTLVACRFAEFVLPVESFLELIETASGLQFDETGLMRMGERLWNMERMFNLAAGIEPGEDRLPARCFEPLEDGRDGDKQLTREELQFMLADYYRERGWGPDGRPTPAKLAELGLG